MNSGLLHTEIVRLIDLDPRWYGVDDRATGVSLACPCADRPDCPGRLAVGFKNPLDGGEPTTASDLRWTRTGDTFETLTLTPSIDVPDHWHGYMRRATRSSMEARS